MCGNCRLKHVSLVRSGTYIYGEKHSLYSYFDARHDKILENCATTINNEIQIIYDHAWQTSCLVDDNILLREITYLTVV